MTVASDTLRKLPLTTSNSLLDGSSQRQTLLSATIVLPWLAADVSAVQTITTAFLNAQHKRSNLLNISETLVKQLRG